MRGLVRIQIIGALARGWMLPSGEEAPGSIHVGRYSGNRHISQIQKINAELEVSKLVTKVGAKHPKAAR